jgi:hypothetical protein
MLSHTVRQRIGIGLLAVIVAAEAVGIATGHLMWTSVLSTVLGIAIAMLIGRAAKSTKRA